MIFRVVSLFSFLCLIQGGCSWTEPFGGGGDLNGTTPDEPCSSGDKSTECLICRGLLLDCSNMNLTSLPNDIPQGTENLNLNGNALGTWNMSSSDSLLPGSLLKLSLNNNQLRAMPVQILKNVTGLRELKLRQNVMERLSENDFEDLSGLRVLDLSFNALVRIEARTFSSLSHLEFLNLGSNQIHSLDKDAFVNLKNLSMLVLEDNRINALESKLLVPMPQLSVLDINKNELTSVPDSIMYATKLEQLKIAKNKIKSIPYGIFQKVDGIVKIDFKSNPLKEIHRSAFSELPHLKKLLISEAGFLTRFLNLTGSRSLEQIRIYRGKISDVPSNLCAEHPRLKILELKSNELESLPDIRDCMDLRLVDLAHNRISSLTSDSESPFYNLSKLHDLLLNHNLIKNITSTVFLGLENLQILDLSHNDIEDINDLAFANLSRLKDVNLGENRFSRMPSEGLDSVVHLKTHNNPALRDFPGPERFPQIQSLVLSYAYHCCQFLPSSHSGRRGKGGGESGSVISPLTGDLGALQETVFFPGENFDASLWSNESSLLWSSPGNEEFSGISPELWDNFGMGAFQEGGVFGSSSGEDYQLHPGITCTPSPGPFMPCNDLFDWWALRCSVWIVFLLALLGNGCVVIVLVASRGKMDVPRFLVCNLAMADFFMGIYLGFLAVVDASTLGEFRKYAIPWQFSAGCQAAGFFGVLSSELSVFTLAVITLERNYAITHAMHLNKRLSLKHAAYIMIGGWTFGLLMASLPLAGISDYRKFAICLPFETGSPLSLGYVVFLMLINGVAFSILMGCYLKMYCAIRGSQAWNSNDSRIAKRMALLVFTDFLCWAPIAFFSLTAAFGVRLVSLEGAKVFTVFILPLNSCCNPFLYAILTKQFKKDCVMICKAVEESRVTRGIGRCRHSSNFSNRQTPANTNSLLNSGGAPGGSYNNTRGTVCSCNAGKKAGVGGSGNSRKINMQFTKIKRLFLGYRKDSSSSGTGAGNDSINTGSNEYPGGRHHHHHHPRYPPGAAGSHANKQGVRRNASVSSDNFSSSRSDSWKIHGRIRLDHAHRPNYRRRNSWTVTRKPSQDSNTSRMDSASSNSTNTWRMSRSSVSSSDAGKNSIGSSSKEVGHTVIQPSTTGKFSALARTQLLNRHFSNTSSGEGSKPKLIRQTAILPDEHSTGSGKSVSFTQEPGRASCPLHAPHPPRVVQSSAKLYGKLIESSHEADDEEEELDPERTKLLKTSSSRSLSDLPSASSQISPTRTSHAQVSAIVEDATTESRAEPPCESDQLLPSVTTRTEKGYLNTDV